MAIVEDGVRHESEEEHEVVLQEDHEEDGDGDGDVEGDGDGEQDSDSSDEDEDDEVMLETKIAILERQITQDPNNYEEHIELLQLLWSLTDLERWRAAFDRLYELFPLRPEHWILRLETEVSLAHTEKSWERVAKLFEQASLDCYSIRVLSEWCAWALALGDVEATRVQLGEVLTRAGADPYSGKLFWDAKLQLEKAQMDSMNVEDPKYKEQRQRVLWCLEEVITRPLLHHEECWAPLQELALMLHDQDYLDKLKIQHEVAIEYLQKIAPFEEKLLVTEDPKAKCKIYLEYFEVVKNLAHEEKYAECDSEGILKVVYDRASTECLSTDMAQALLMSFARHAQARGSRATVTRVLAACVRRAPRRGAFWALSMQQAEHEGKRFDEIKSIFERALSKGMESFKDTELLWLTYCEFVRRQTDFKQADSVDRLRRTFRLAWDSLAEAWGDEANDCELPVYWARLEYTRMNNPVQGKEIFEEIFKYGENRTLSKYWEALITLEQARACSERTQRRVRELCARALRCVTDYPPIAARMWLDWERDYGDLPALLHSREMCGIKLKHWRESYQAMKDKMVGKSNVKNKQIQIKKTKTNSKKKGKDDKQGKGKRKAEEAPENAEVKRKKDNVVAVQVKNEDVDTGGGQKRALEKVDGKTDDGEASQSKRQRTVSESGPSAGREACTLFVSNLAYDVNEENLRDQLSKYGEIVSLRMRAGVKAFGGSICYCQYKSPESVEEALKHDREPLDGRPMFLSRYSASKSKQHFKYPVTAEKNKLFVKGLPFSHCTKEKLSEIFDKYGALKDVRVVTFKDGKPKGLAYIEYEDESAAQAALAATDGLTLEKRQISVAVSAPPPKGAPPPPSLGEGKRDNGGGMRRGRTQLSSFIPSVLARASTSRDGAEPPAARVLSNKDFRDLLLNK